MTDVNRGGREEDSSWIYPNGHVEGDGSRADHKIRGKRSAKANLLFGLDGIHCLECQEAKTPPCTGVGTSNHGPPGTSDDSAIWTDHAVESKRLNREIDALYYFECGVIIEGVFRIELTIFSYFFLRKVQHGTQNGNWSM